MSPAERCLELSRLLDGTSITLLSFTEGGETLTLRRPPGSGPAAPPSLIDRAPGVAADRVVAAPCAGVFRLAHPQRAERLAETGRPVSAGAPLGLLQVGPLLLEVRAPVGGTLCSVAAADGALVGYGTPLFRLSPMGDEA